jgi:hypothetical protein
VADIPVQQDASGRGRRRISDPNAKAERPARVSNVERIVACCPPQGLAPILVASMVQRIGGRCLAMAPISEQGLCCAFGQANDRGQRQFGIDVAVELGRKLKQQAATDEVGDRGSLATRTKIAFSGTVCRRSGDNRECEYGTNRNEGCESRTRSPSGHVTTIGHWSAGDSNENMTIR